MHDMTCINCGNPVSEKFCATCGQRTNVKRITFRQGWNDFWSRVYGFDGMFPRTFKDLTIRPGLVARKYIDGNRVLYYGPVGYFFLMITLYLLLMSAFNVDVRDFLQQTQKIFTPVQQGESQQKISQLMMDVVSDNLKIVAFFIMPFNALAARYFVFRKSGLNFLEHMVVPFYVAGHVYWIGFISIPLYKFFNITALNSVTVIVLLFYFGLAYANLMKYQPRWKAFMKGILVYVVGQLILFNVVAFITIFIIILLSYIDPVTFDIFRPK